VQRVRCNSDRSRNRDLRRRKLNRSLVRSSNGRRLNVRRDRRKLKVSVLRNRPNDHAHNRRRSQNNKARRRDSSRRRPKVVLRLNVVEVKASQPSLASLRSHKPNTHDTDCDRDLIAIRVNPSPRTPATTLFRTHFHL
jgi:hypothetical protein